jgi:PadR family transcriptional regulator PadR
MKGTNLGEFEELVLLVVGIMQGEAYGVGVMDEIINNTNRTVTVSTIHTALNRLESKGFVDSYYGGASNTRGGRRKRLYRITGIGVGVLQEAKGQREKLWNLFTSAS